MRYNFEQNVDRRGTNSTKADNKIPGIEPSDVLQMWVADMDLPCPTEVVTAVQQRAAHPVYGYSYVPDSLKAAIVERVKRHWGWTIKPEWLVFTSGIVAGLNTVVRAFTKPGDEVVVQMPVYFPFFSAITNNGSQIVNNPLKFDGERYELDIDHLRQLLKPETTFPVRASRIKELLLCNPHNPVGRVWGEDELRRLGQLCVDSNCLIVSDEIHADLMLDGAKHTCIASLSPEFEQRSVTFMAASKSFNVAGLQTSFAIIPNDALRAQFNLVNLGGGNAFGYAALEAAYRYGDDYLTELNAHLTANVAYFSNYIREHIPEIKVIKPEGTYLLWVDFRGLGLGLEQLQKLMRSVGLAFNEGFTFGKGGEGFERVNLGCSRATVVECCRRLEKAVRTVRP